MDRIHYNGDHYLQPYPPPPGERNPSLHHTGLELLLGEDYCSVRITSTHQSMPNTTDMREKQKKKRQQPSEGI